MPLNRVIVWFLLSSVVPGRPIVAAPSLIDEVEGLAQISSVSGREFDAAEFIQQRLGDLKAEQDALGNLIVTLGSGEPRRLFVAPLDEPGYVVSQIRDDGYLRLAPVGAGYRGTLADQYLEGQKIQIVTESGLVFGAVTVPSAHLAGLRPSPPDVWPPFTWQDAYVDVGAESAQEARRLGLELMDPVTLIKRPSRLENQRLAAPSMQTKAACLALVDAARRLSASPSQKQGTVVIAWTVLELLNGKGLEAVVAAHGPFDEAFLFSRHFGFTPEQQPLLETLVPEPGDGVLTSSPSEKWAGALSTPHADLFRFPITGGPDWQEAEVTYLGLPTRHAETPVETVALGDVRRLSDIWLEIAGGDPRQAPAVPEFIAKAPPAPAQRPHEEMADLLASLVARYGVSGAEAPVRQRIRELLPPWAEPQTDEVGNLWITFGAGDEHVVFIAHMDETGYRVKEIRRDGRLVLEARGGMLPWIWEAQAALVHTKQGSIPAIFEPRKNAHQAERRFTADPLTVDLGVSSKKAARALGARAGESTVTMPKHMIRLGEHRALARAFDDRAGSLALVQAALRVNPKKLRRRVTFAWSVQEEVGMAGARQLADRFQQADRVYPVDTFVSSDAPLENPGLALCPLGKGAVIRVLESINFAPRRGVRHLLQLAQANDIPVQVGMTSGGTDGQSFLAHGIVSMPISWPGRYSHSPIEVLDFRDLEALVELIQAIVKDPL